MSKYAEDGVNILEGDSFSAFCGRLFRSTFHNNRYAVMHDLSSGHFRGPRGFTLNDQYDPMVHDYILTAVADGVGTKTIITVSAGSFINAASDVLAMTGGDITRYGGVRLGFSNVLDASNIGHTGEPVNKAFRDMMLGMKVQADEQGIIVFGGETAELGVCVSSENLKADIKYNWAGFMIGLYDPQRMILGETLAEGQIVVALYDFFRSNGISSVRKALKKRFGDTWFEQPEAQAVITACAAPATIYDKFLEDVNGWYENDPIPVHLIAHVTGGSIKSKFAEDLLFRLGLSADLDELFDPPHVMKMCAAWRGLTDEEAYETWNGGQGALVVLDEENVAEFLDRAKNYEIVAKVCGKITNEPTPRVRIVSKYSGNEFFYRTE